MFYNEKIKERFEQLGKEDWAYNYDGPSKFGEFENQVNLTYNG